MKCKWYHLDEFMIVLLTACTKREQRAKLQTVFVVVVVYMAYIA